MKQILAALLALPLAASADAVFPFAGEAPAISPDGRFLAFQRVEDRRMHLGVLDLETGKTEWIARGATAETRKENACHPAWGPDGELVFAYANLTNTAYQRFHANGGAKDGYRIRTWRDGKVADLVGDFARNYGPSFSPDGKTVYFCRQTSGFRGVAKVSRANPAKVMKVFNDPPYDGGVSQPVVSPDGRFLAYAELAKRTWGLKVVPVDAPLEQRCVTPGVQSAYAPNWMPDGKHLVYTGFTPGDPSWGVYVVNLADRSTRRICDGTDPCVSSDGRWLYYAKDGRIYRRAVEQTDLPVAAVPPPDPRRDPKKILAEIPGSFTNRTSHPFRFEAAGLSTNVSHYVRFKVDWDGRTANSFLLAGGLDGAGSYWIFVINGCMSFHGTEPGSTCVAVNGEKLAKGVHELTCVHGSDGVIYGSVDGGPWMARSGAFATGPVSGKGNVSTFPNGAPDDKVKVFDVEVGLGWPISPSSSGR